MRLGQLARQLQVTPKDILKYLEDKHNVELKTHPNSKVPDEFIDELTEALAKLDDEEVEESKTEWTPSSKKKDDEEQVEVLSLQDPDEDTGPVEKVEAEIPSIDGPTIVGKIELPESELNRTKPERKPKRERPEKMRRRPKRDKSKSKDKKLETEAERRAREIREIESRRKANAESLKELNKQKYLEKNQSTSQPAATKKKKKKLAKELEIQKEEQKRKQAENKPKPKSVIGKLWSWLNDG